MDHDAIIAVLINIAQNNLAKRYLQGCLVRYMTPEARIKEAVDCMSPIGVEEW